MCRNRLEPRRRHHIPESPQSSPRCRTTHQPGHDQAVSQGTVGDTACSPAALASRTSSIRLQHLTEQDDTPTATAADRLEADLRVLRRLVES